MAKYRDRREAGIILAEQLKQYINKKNVIVLALPRGGVPVAAEISTALQVPLDVFIVRKLGMPGHEEFAMGAIAMGGAVLFNADIFRDLTLPKTVIDTIIATEQAELSRREKKYRGNRPFPTLTGKIVILVDDGIATGATIRVAVQAIRALNPAKLVIAVPVAQKSVCKQIAQIVDEMVCPLQPEHLYAVGEWYEQFDQTEDSEVQALLRQGGSV